MWQGPLSPRGDLRRATQGCPPRVSHVCWMHVMLGLALSTACVSWILIFTAALLVRGCYYAHFTGGKTEAQRAQGLACGLH